MAEIYIIVIPALGILIVLIYLFSAYFDEIKSAMVFKNIDKEDFEEIKVNISQLDDSNPEKSFYQYCINQLNRNANSARSNHRLLLLSTLTAFFVALALLLFSLLIFSTGMYEKIGYLSQVASIISAFFSSTFLVLFNKTAKEKERYVTEVSRIKDLLLIVDNINKIEDSNMKNAHISELIVQLLKAYNFQKLNQV